jgi:hypothetical protein
MEARRETKAPSFIAYAVTGKGEDFAAPNLGMSVGHAVTHPSRDSNSRSINDLQAHF